MDEVVKGFFSLVLLLVFLICCYSCCCRCCCCRPTGPGVVYIAPGTGTSNSVTVNLPPQQVTQQLPYPSVVAHPQQQTPHPPQYATNPYYNMPPPANNQAAGMQQSPSAPPQQYNMMG